MKSVSQLLLGLALLTGVASGASGPVLILQQPTNQTVFEGGSASFGVTADGTEPIGYQWFRDGDAIAGATQGTLKISPVSAADNASVYSVTCSNASGSVPSSNATLTVKPGIIVAATVNDSTELDLPGGWPLILEVSFIHPEVLNSNLIPILICSTNGPWSNAVSVEVRDAQQQLQSWLWQAAPMTNETLLLNRENRGILLWTLSPTQTGQLGVGTYEVTVSLQTTNVTKPDAWNGIVKSVPVLVNVVNPPAAITEEVAEQKARLFARYAMLQGNEPQARQEVAALLTSYPTNLGGLTMTMYLQRDSGQLSEALQTVERALDVVNAQAPLALEPPEELLQNLVELQALLTPPSLSLNLVAGQLTLQWLGRTNAQYKLEASDDLKTWTVQATNFVMISNSYSFSTSVVSPQLFFRVSF